MKKLFYIFLIIFFLFSKNPSHAGGILNPPKVSPYPPAQPVYNLPAPSTEPTEQIKVQTHPQDLYKESLTPIYKSKGEKELDLNSEKTLEAQASAEISAYEKISLPDAIKYALENNLDIKGNRINIEISSNDIKKANRLQNPYLLSFANTGRAATDNPNNAGLLFPIELGKRGPRKALAKSNLDLTKKNVALAEFALRMDVREAYINLVAAKSALKILNEHRKLLQELLDVAQRKYDLGAAPGMDVIHAKMTLNQLLIQVNSANTDVYTARYYFNKVLNSKTYDTLEDYLPEQQEVIYLLTPKPTEQMPSFNELLNVALENRLDLKTAQKEIEVAQKNLTVTVRQRIPDIEIGGGIMYVPEQFATDDKSTSGIYFAGNITNIPLLYQYTPEIKNAKLQLEQKVLAYKNLKNNTSLTLRSAYDEFNTAKDNLNYYNDILLSESYQFVNMAKQSYKVGKSNITDFIFIQQSYKTILMGYTAALEQYYDAWVNVLKEVNDEELKLNG